MKKEIFYLFGVLLLGVAGLALVSCDDDDDKGEVTPQEQELPAEQWKDNLSGSWRATGDYGEDSFMVVDGVKYTYTGIFEYDLSFSPDGNGTFSYYTEQHFSNNKQTIRKGAFAFLWEYMTDSGVFVNRYYLKIKITKVTDGTDYEEGNTCTVGLSSMTKNKVEFFPAEYFETMNYTRK